jgi:hypothetical protein
VPNAKIAGATPLPVGVDRQDHDRLQLLTVDPKLTAARRRLPPARARWSECVRCPFDGDRNGETGPETDFVWWRPSAETPRSVSFLVWARLALARPGRTFPDTGERTRCPDAASFAPDVRDRHRRAEGHGRRRRRRR